MENILCVLRQINACLGLYESEKLAKSGMTFAQVFLLNEILAMEPPKIFSHELCKRVGLAKSSVSRTLKELKYLVHAGAGGRVHQTHDWRGVARFQPLGPGTAEACPGLPCGAALLLWL